MSHLEEKAYLAAASPLLRDVAVLILETGMRPEEVYTIKKESVHLEATSLALEDEMQAETEEAETA